MLSSSHLYIDSTTSAQHHAVQGPQLGLLELPHDLWLDIFARLHQPSDVACVLRACRVLNATRQDPMLAASWLLRARRAHALSISARSGLADVLRLVIQLAPRHGLELRLGGVPGEGALCEAAALGHTAAVRVLLAHGVAANGQEGSGHPLAAAASTGKVEVLQVLLEGVGQPEQGGGAAHQGAHLSWRSNTCKHTATLTTPPHGGEGPQQQGDAGPSQPAIPAAARSAGIPHDPRGRRFRDPPDHLGWSDPGTSPDAHPHDSIVNILHSTLQNSPQDADVQRQPQQAQQPASDDRWSTCQAPAAGSNVADVCAGDNAALIAAAAAGAMGALRLLLDQGAHADARGGEALCAAAGGGHCGCLRVLLERGCKLREGKALRWAAAEGHVEALRLLWGQGGSSLDGAAAASLALAAHHGHVEVVRQLLAWGVDVGAGEGEALIAACASGHTPLVEVLLCAGTDLRLQDGRALRVASEAGHNDVVRVLLGHGADPGVGDQAAIKAAARAGNLDLLRMLLEAGADPHVGEEYPLRSAASAGCESVVAELLAAPWCADPNASDGEALLWAADNGHEGVVRLLLDAGADGAGVSGEQALWAAVMAGHTEVVRVLTAAGAALSPDLMEWGGGGAGTGEGGDGSAGVVDGVVGGGEEGEL